MKYITELKLLSRYVVLGFIMYLAYMVTSIDYVNAFEGKDTTLQIVVGAIFGAMTLVLNAHFANKVER